MLNPIDHDWLMLMAQFLCPISTKKVTKFTF